jgi:hypothetical protein
MPTIRKGGGFFLRGSGSDRRANLVLDSLKNRIIKPFSIPVGGTKARCNAVQAQHKPA